MLGVTDQGVPGSRSYAQYLMLDQGVSDIWSYAQYLISDQGVPGSWCYVQHLKLSLTVRVMSITSYRIKESQTVMCGSYVQYLKESLTIGVMANTSRNPWQLELWSTSCQSKKSLMELWSIPQEIPDSIVRKHKIWENVLAFTHKEHTSKFVYVGFYKKG